MPGLLDPFTLRSLTLRNRIGISPMCMYSATDGVPNDWHLVHLGSRAVGGAGLVFTEATAVVPEGRISPEDTGIWNDEQQAAWARIVDFVHGQGAAAGTQLAHAGRKASTQKPWEGDGYVEPADGGWQTVAPSAIPYLPDGHPPTALDRDGLARVRDAFARAAQRAARVGLDAVQLHAAHGYLLHEFLSPLSNRRTDGYGGSFEGRTRLALEIVDAVRAEVGEAVPVFVRISATDWVEDGWDLDETVELAQALKRAGSPALHVSTGGVSPKQAIKLGPGYQVPYAERIKAETGLTTIAVGLITEASQAEAILQEGKADAISLARAMLYDPRWPWHAAAELGARVRAPKQYWRSQPREYKDLFKDTAFGQR